MTEPLSPAAQAVRDQAIYKGPELEKRVAAALRAAADQAHEVPAYIRGDDYMYYTKGVESERQRNLAIAAELEAHS